MKVVYSSDFLKHDFEGHPERAARVLAIKHALDAKGFSDYIEAKPASEKEILKVHTKRLLSELKEHSARGLGSIDNPFSKETCEIAKLSAGSAIIAAKHASEFAFSLARPPGHHAGKDFFEGFCYLNNIAIAVASLLKNYSRVLIVDFDLHLGQGTQNIFTGSEAVYYFSMHQDTSTIYPWRDFPIRDNTTKLVPLQPGTTDTEYLKIFGKELKEINQGFEPELIACSAGFDIFYADRFYVGSLLNITNPETFKKIGSIISNAKLPCFAVLEGGYHLETLGLLARKFLEGLAYEGSDSLSGAQ